MNQQMKAFVLKSLAKSSGSLISILTQVLEPTSTPAQVEAIASELVSCLTPSQLSRMHDELQFEISASLRHAYQLDGERWTIHAVESAHEAHLLAFQIAIHKRYPLLPIEGCRAVTRPPVIYGDASSLAEKDRWSWRLMLTQDSFCAVEPRKRILQLASNSVSSSGPQSPSSHQHPSSSFFPPPAAISASAFSSSSSHLQILSHLCSQSAQQQNRHQQQQHIDLFGLDVDQLEAEIEHDRSLGRLPTLVCAQLGLDLPLPSGIVAEKNCEYSRFSSDDFQQVSSASSSQAATNLNHDESDVQANSPPSSESFLSFKEPASTKSDPLTNLPLKLSRCFHGLDHCKRRECSDLKSANAKHDQAMNEYIQQCSMACWRQDDVAAVRQVCDRHHIWCHLGGSLLSLPTAFSDHGISLSAILSSDSFVIQPSLLFPELSATVSSSLVFLCVRESNHQASSGFQQHHSTNSSLSLFKVKESLLLWWLVFAERIAIAQPSRIDAAESSAAVAIQVVGKGSETSMSNQTSHSDSACAVETQAVATASRIASNTVDASDPGRLSSDADASSENPGLDSIVEPPNPDTSDSLTTQASSILSSALSLLISEEAVSVTDEEKLGDDVSSQSNEHFESASLVTSYVMCKSEGIICAVQHLQGLLLEHSDLFYPFFGTSSRTMPHVLAFQLCFPAIESESDSAPPSSLPDLFGYSVHDFHQLLFQHLPGQFSKLHIDFVDSLPSSLVQATPVWGNVDASSASSGWFVFQPLLWVASWRNLEATLLAGDIHSSLMISIIEFVSALRQHLHFLHRVAVLREWFSAELRHGSQAKRDKTMYFEIALPGQLQTPEESDPHQPHPADELIASESAAVDIRHNFIRSDFVGLGAFRCVPTILSVSPVAVDADDISASNIQADPILDAFNESLALVLHTNHPELFSPARTNSGAVCIAISAQLPLASESVSSRAASHDGTFASFSSSSSSNSTSTSCSPHPSSVSLSSLNASAVHALRPRSFSENSSSSAFSELELLTSEELMFGKALTSLIWKTSSRLELPPMVAQAMETALQRGIREAELRLQQKQHAPALIPVASASSQNCHSDQALVQSTSASSSYFGSWLQPVFSWWSSPQAPSSSDSAHVQHERESPSEQQSAGAVQAAKLQGQHFDLRFGFDIAFEPARGARSSSNPFK